MGCFQNPTVHHHFPFRKMATDGGIPQTNRPVDIKQFNYHKPTQIHLNHSKSHEILFFDQLDHVFSYMFIWLVVLTILKNIVNGKDDPIYYGR